MFKTIRSKILLYIVVFMAFIFFTFMFITTKNFQIEMTDQHKQLVRETLASTMRIIDTEYSDLLSYEIDSINNQRSIMENVGTGIISMIDSFYELQKKGLLPEEFAKKQCLKKLREYRYQKDKYFFAYDFDLIGLSHPKKDMIGKKWSGFEDLKKKDALGSIVEIIKAEKQVFTVFMWPRLEDMKPVKQMGYFLYYPQWDWIIGTVYELEHIERVSLNKEKITLVHLREAIKKMKLNNTGCVFIFDSSGKIIIHTSNLRNTELYHPKKILDKSIQNILEKAALDTETSIEYSCRKKNQKTKLNIAYVDYYKPMQWYVVALVDKNKLLKPVFDIAKKQFFILLMVLFIGIAVAAFVSKRITNPLLLLTQYSRDLPNNAFKSTNKDLLKNIQLKSKNDEIKELAGAFSYMESELGKNIRNLEEYQKNLEDMVDIRTKELTNTNKNLKKEIAERKEAELKLKTSESRFRSIIESVSEISIQGYDKERKVIFWNQASEKLYGYSNKEAIGKKIETLIMPQTMHEEVKNLITRWVEFGEKIPAGEYDLIDKNYDTVPVFSSHVMIKTPHGKEMYCIDIDLKPIRKAEAALRESEKKYRHLFENAPSGMFEIDLVKSKLVSVNEIMCEYSGYSEDEFLSMDPLDLLTKESKEIFLDRFAKVSVDRRPTDTIEYNIVTKGGNELCILFSNDYIFENEQLIGARVVAHNITDRKKNEKEKILAQKIAAENEKLALVGQIAGKMAHDFNNVLGVIMGNTELSLQDCEEVETRKTLKLILVQTLRGKNLTKNLVAFAKDQELKQEFFKIDEKIDLVLTLLKKDLKGIDLIKENEPGVEQLLADPGMIEHALVNLIYNSIHALSKIEDPRIIIRTYSHADNIIFEIKDNGCGIPNKYLERIFEPSFTLKGIRDVTGSYKKDIKGTGYGMANVKKYIEQHKGKIVVESEPGSGTKFTVILPMIKKDSTK